MPVMNTLGKNTEQSTSVMAMIGPVISSIALIVAERTSRPVPMRRSMFFQHDDGVIHDDADGQHQAEQRQVVECEAQHAAMTGERCHDEHDNRHVNHRQDRGSPILQEEQDDQMATRMTGVAQRLEDVL